MSTPVAIIGGHNYCQQKLLAGVRRFLPSSKDKWETWMNCPGVFGAQHQLDMDRLGEQGEEGVLFLGIRRLGEGPALLEKLKRLSIPVVFAAQFYHADPPLPSVLPDDREAGRMMAEHLLEKGFHNFAFYGMAGERPFTTRREEAFLDEIRKHGYEVSVHRSSSPTPEDEREGMFAQLHAWLGSLPHPTGLAACIDPFAMGAINGCRDMGIQMPEHVAIVGVSNDSTICEATSPNLSSVDLNLMRIGAEAAAMLDDILDGKPPPRQPVLIPPKGLVERESTSIGPIPDPLVAQCAHYVQAHLTEGVTIEHLLHHVHTSKRTLQMRFKEALGETPGQMIRRMQVEKARSLLAETDWQIGRVAYAAGFQTQSHFNTSFKRLTGQTPTAYRKQIRET